MKTKILVDFQISISVPSSYLGKNNYLKNYLSSVRLKWHVVNLAVSKKKKVYNKIVVLF